MKPINFREIVEKERVRRDWSFSELDRQAGLWVGDSRKFIVDEKNITCAKLEKLLMALEMKVVRG